MQKRVLFIRSDVKLAGPGRLMVSSALALRDIGFDVVFASSGGALVPEIEAKGFQHFTLPDLAVDKRSLWGMLRCAWQIQHIARKEKVSILHSFNALAGLTAVPARLLNRIPLFNTVLGNGREKMLRYMPFKLVAVSNSVRDKLERYGVPKAKITVIYNATLDDRFVVPDRAAFDALQKARQKITPFTLISVAVMTGQKGHAEILNALAAYQKRDDRKPIRMIFVGDGPKQSAMEDHAAKLGLTDIVTFVGASDRVSAYLDQAHCFIHLAEMETFGIVIAEANARGLPIIASNVGGIPEVMLDEKTGLLVDRNNVDQIAQAISRFADNPALAEQFGWEGALYAAKMFKTEKMGQDLKELYQQSPQEI